MSAVSKASQKMLGFNLSSCIVSLPFENLIHLVLFTILHILSVSKLAACCQGSKQIPKAQSLAVCDLLSIMSQEQIHDGNKLNLQ